MPRILVASDGAEPIAHACRAAVGLLGAPRADVDVRLLTVLSYHLYPGAMVPGEKAPGEVEMISEVERAVGAAVAAAEQIFTDAGFKVSVTHRFGNPRDEILSEVADYKPDLLVLGRRGLRGVERWLGSVSEPVAREAGVPVLLSP